MERSSPIKQKVLRLTLSFAFLAALLLANGSSRAADDSDCLPGVPCLGVPLTPNDPWDPDDGPNNEAPHKDKSTDDACDADFMNQIYARAFLEAERENIKAEILIRKPDSVLEYSCFASRISEAAGAGALFSESDYWEDRIVPIIGLYGDHEEGIVEVVPFVEVKTYMESGKLQRMLDKLVKETNSEYLANSGYQHDYLGGYATGENGCGQMNSIYYIAKCMDMIVDEEFYTFKDLVGNDPRLLPTACTGGTAITQEHINLARNKGWGYAYYDSMEFVDRSRNLTVSNFMDPATCLEPIETGIQVIWQDKEIDNEGNTTIVNTAIYPEKTCINPGCFYFYDRQSNTGECRP